MVILISRLIDYAFRAWMVMLFLALIGHPIGFLTALFGIFVSGLILNDAALAPVRHTALKAKIDQWVIKAKGDSAK